MALKVLGTLIGMALFATYFLPVALKLKETSLIVIIVGGVVLAAIDAWHTFKDGDD